MAYPLDRSPVRHGAGTERHTQKSDICLSSHQVLPLRKYYISPWSKNANQSTAKCESIGV